MLPPPGRLTWYQPSRLPETASYLYNSYHFCIMGASELQSYIDFIYLRMCKEHDAYWMMNVYNGINRTVR